MQVVNLNGRYILPVKEDCSCNFILSYAFPLSIAEWNKEFREWNYQNYMEIYYSYSNDLNMDIQIIDGQEYGINERLTPDLYEVYHYNENLVYNTIIETIIEALDQKKYLIVFLDEQKLGLTESTFIHESMFIGYNFEEKEFYVLCFVNYKYKKRTITFEEKCQAFRSAVENKEILSSINDEILY